MNTDTIYREFCKNTSISDSLYEIVFNKIGDRLKPLQDIVWKSISYIEAGSDTHLFDFTKRKAIPIYVAELINNVFEGYYTLPANVTVELELGFRGVDYKIIQKSSEIEFPQELSFLKNDGLYKMFFIPEQVYDVFGEFDSVFRFIFSFKENQQEVFPPLKKRFEEVSAVDSVKEGSVSDFSVTQKQIVVESLQSKIQDILSKIESLQTEREELSESQQTIHKYVYSRSGIILERDKLLAEYDSLSNSKKYIEEKYSKIDATLQEIEAEISAAIDNGNQTFSKFLQDKKELFGRERDSFKKSLDDINILCNGVSSRLKDMNAALENAEHYTKKDLDIIQEKMQSLDKEHDDLYGMLMSLELELKKTKSEVNSDAIKLSQSQSLRDLTINDVEKTSIVTHLSMPSQPISVVTVSNYLRYYFAFHVSSLAQELGKYYPDLHIYNLQSIATRVFFAKHFGLFFNTLFSRVFFAYKNVDKVIMVVKE